MPRSRNARTAWYRSPWFIGPVVVGTGALAGAAVVRAATGGADCSGVGTGGGTVAGVRYLERMRGGATPDEAVPMVVVLHSLGGTPEGYANGFGGIGRVRLILPEGALEGGGGRKWWNRGLHDAVESGFAASDLAEWTAASSRLSEFIRQIVRCRPTVGRPVITGSSQGAEAALLVATQHRKQVHGAVAVNGDMPDPLWSARMAPVAMLNGTGDTTVPFAWAKAHAEAMIARGAPLRFAAFASEGHAVTSAMSHAWLNEIERMVAEVSQQG